MPLTVLVVDDQPLEGEMIALVLKRSMSVRPSMLPTESAWPRCSTQDSSFWISKCPE